MANHENWADKLRPWTPLDGEDINSKRSRQERREDSEAENGQDKPVRRAIKDVGDRTPCRTSRR